jgi:hypothetical protein
MTKGATQSRTARLGKLTPKRCRYCSSHDPGRGGAADHQPGMFLDLATDIEKLFNTRCAFHE